MKEQAGKVDATPSKRLFLSIIADYGLNRAICELIDNALDNWIKLNKLNKLDINIEINFDQQTISIKDNSGGVQKSDLKFIVGPGQTGNNPSDQLIGIFGVGTKRATVALSQDIKITTRYKEEKTFRVEFDDTWLQDESWELPLYEVDEIDENSTIIDLQKLRSPVDTEKVNRLKEHLQKTYAKFLSNKNLIIRVNDEPLIPIHFENWAFPPSLEPRKLRGVIVTKDGKVDVEIIAGLTKESSPAVGEYGVYFYCNDRLIAQRLKTFEVGFTKGLAGFPHPSISLVRIIISLNGPANLMPWNSSKSGINYEHKIFRSFRESIIQIVKTYASISRSFAGKWEDVFKHGTGDIIELDKIDFPNIRSLSLPPIPKVRMSYNEVLEQTNRQILNDKPWTRGLFGGITAINILSRQKVNEKNRILLILLDSILEIAFKEFLVNESEYDYSDQDLYRIFQRRNIVEDEVKKFIKIRKTLWRKIEHYYRLRCKLIHERSTISISAEDINDYRSIIEEVFTKLFKLNFKIEE